MHRGVAVRVEPCRGRRGYGGSVERGARQFYLPADVERRNAREEPGPATPDTRLRPHGSLNGQEYSRNEVSVGRVLWITCRARQSAPQVWPRASARGAAARGGSAASDASTMAFPPRVTVPRAARPGNRPPSSNRPVAPREAGLVPLSVRASRNTPGANASDAHRATSGNFRRPRWRRGLTDSKSAN